MYRVTLFILVSAIVVSSHVLCVFGQVGTWRTFTNTNFIQDITSEGDTLWLATTGGVVLFDVEAYDFIHTITNVDGLAHVTVSSITIDRKGHIWFGTQGGGVSKWKRPQDDWRTYAAFDGIPLHISVLWKDDSSLWVGSKEGISFFQWGWDWDEKDTTYIWKENYDSRNGLVSDIVTSIVTDDSIVWVGTERGVSAALKRSNLKDPQSWISYTVEEGLPSSDVLSLALNDSRIWVGTGDGVAFFNGHHWIEAGLSETRINSLIFAGDTLWAGTSRGVFKLVENQWIPVANESLPSQDVRVVASTKTGRIVCGTWGKGLSVFDGVVWSRFLREGPWRNNCERVMTDRTGFVWVSMFEPPYTAKLSRYSDGQWDDFSENEGIETGNRILGMMEDSEGRKWFGTWGDGVSRLNDYGTLEKDDDEWMVFNALNSGLHGIPIDPTYEVITDIVEDNFGNIWFANFEFGAVVYSPEDSIWESYTPTDGLVDRLARSLAVTSGGAVWIGSEQNGVSLLSTNGTPFIKSDDNWQTFNADNGFTNTTVNSILEDGQGIVWLGTSEGLFYFDRGRLYRDINIQNTGVLCLHLDIMDNIWVGTTDSALFVFNRQGDLQFRFNNVNSGLVDNEVRSIAFNEESGEVWLATPVGLSRYESGIIKPKIESDEVMSIPNPFILSQGTEPLVTFSLMPNETSVRIYTISGELVIELGPNSNRWDGRNNSGELVGSGIYIVVVTSSSVSPRIGKLAVIR